MNSRLLALVVVACGLAFALGRVSAGTGAAPASATETGATADASPPAPAAPVSAPPSARTEQAAPARSLALLERCTDQLTRARARIRAVPSSGAGEPRAEPDGEPDRVAACLADEVVRETLRREFELAPVREATGDSDGSGASAASQGGPSFARRFSTDVVGVSGDEAWWMEAYLCEVHQLREGMVAELAELLERSAPAEDVDALLKQAKADRAAALEDMKAQLGEERYARLRAVGGLGIMGAALDCASR